jgi:hypothetical protein
VGLISISCCAKSDVISSFETRPPLYYCGLLFMGAREMDVFAEKKRKGTSLC